MKTTFGELSAGQEFYINGYKCKKTEPVTAPQRGYLISNAVNLDNGKKLRLGGPVSVWVVGGTVQLDYSIREDRQLGHMVVAVLPESRGYTIFKHGTEAECQEYIDTLTPDKEFAEISRIVTVNKGE